MSVEKYFATVQSHNNVTASQEEGCGTAASTLTNISLTEEEVLGCSMSSDYECTISFWLYVICVPCLILFGTIGNVLTAVVMTTTDLRKSAFGTYLAAIAIADTLVLWTALPRHFIRWIWLVDLQLQHAWSCRLLRLLKYSLMNISAWLLVAVTTERFMTVHFPHRFRVHGHWYERSRRARRVIASVTLFHFAWNLHIFWTLGEQRVDECTTKACGYPTAAIEYYWKHVHVWLDATKLSVLPFVLMLTMNAAIMVNLRRRSLEKERRRSDALQRSKNLSETEPGSADAHAAQKLAQSSSHGKTLMLLWVSFFYVMTTVPAFVSTAMVHAEAGSPLISSVTSIAMFMNNALNFLLYSLSGTEFRRLIVQALCRRPACATAAGSAAQFQKPETASA